jgi:hypothetical protein
MKEVIGFNVKRISKATEEKIRADECLEEGNPLEYIFLRQGKEVERMFAHSLEKKPAPIHPRTPEELAQWKAFVAKARRGRQAKKLRTE